jgi:anti-sigma B factor antagonist
VLGIVPRVTAVEVSNEGAQAVVVLRGEVDIATTPAFDAAIAALIGPDIVLDLSSVTFMGSSGLATLLRASRRASELGGSMVLRSPSRPVRDLLMMTHLTERFTYEEPS